MKETLAKIRTGLGENSPQFEADLKGIESAVSELTRKVADQEETIHQVNNESKTRKLKIREYEGQVEDLQIKLDALQSKNPELEKELTELREFKTNKAKEARNTWTTKFEKVKESPAFEKVKSRFIINDDWSSVSDEEIGKNLSKLAEYEELGIFDTKTTTKTTTEHPGAAEGQLQKSDFKNMTPAERRAKHKERIALYTE